jgi:2-dehydropantoate 2-reductase
MPAVAIVGPGAIGCSLIVHLARCGHRVAACVRTPIAKVDLEYAGKILTATPEVWQNPAQARPVDWVLIATKAYDVAGAAAWLPGLTGADTRVAIVQNGVEHRERFAAHVPDERLVPVIIDLPVERTAPGKVRQRGGGIVTVPSGRNGDDFVALFAGSPIAAKTSGDWRTVAWRKLCLNAAGAVNALTKITSRVAHNEDAAEVMRELVREAIAVGRAEGAVLEDAVVEQVIATQRAAPPDGMNSLLADRIAGRPMEIDARNGVIVRLGRRYGIPTPCNRAVVALLKTVSAFPDPTGPSDPHAR